MTDDIELIIKIPKAIYEASQILDVKYEDTIQIPLEVIANGILLPKGHGDLVDLNQLDSRMYHEAFETDTDLQKWDSGCWIRYKMYENIRDTAPTIIEADKAESEDRK